MNQSLFLKKNIDFGVSDVEVNNVVPLTISASVGQKLSDARRQSSEIDLEKISRELCIRPHLLNALEQDDFDKFPSACYAAGFLKNYASYLGLNVSQMVAQYRNEFQGSAKKVDLVFLEVKKNHNYIQQMIVSLLILSALVIYGVWYSSSGSGNMMISVLPDTSASPANILISAVEENQTVEDNMLSPATDTIEPEPEFHFVQKVNASPLKPNINVNTAKTDQFRLSVKEDVWIRILDADQDIIVDRILLTGEEFFMADHKGMTLMTSNVGALSLFVGGIALSPMGELGEIRDNISLDMNDLLVKTAHLSP